MKVKWLLTIMSALLMAACNDAAISSVPSNAMSMPTQADSDSHRATSPLLNCTDWDLAEITLTWPDENLVLGGRSSVYQHEKRLYTTNTTGFVGWVDLEDLKTDYVEVPEEYGRVHRLTSQGIIFQNARDYTAALLDYNLQPIKSISCNTLKRIRADLFDWIVLPDLDGVMYFVGSEYDGMGNIMKPSEIQVCWCTQDCLEETILMDTLLPYPYDEVFYFPKRISEHEGVYHYALMAYDTKIGQEKELYVSSSDDFIIHQNNILFLEGYYKMDQHEMVLFEEPMDSITYQVGQDGTIFYFKTDGLNAALCTYTPASGEKVETNFKVMRSDVFLPGPAIVTSLSDGRLIVAVPTSKTEQVYYALSRKT